MKTQRVRTTFAQVAIGEKFYTGVGFWVKRSATTAQYFGLSTKYNQYDVEVPSDKSVSVDAKETDKA